MRHRYILKHIDQTEKELAAAFLRHKLPKHDLSILQDLIHRFPSRWMLIMGIDSYYIKDILACNGFTSKNLGCPLDLAWMGILELACEDLD